MGWTVQRPERRAIEREVTDGLLEARGKGAKNVRLVAEGAGVRVDIVTSATEANNALRLIQVTRYSARDAGVAADALSVLAAVWLVDAVPG